jgi:hypothetical protein
MSTYFLPPAVHACFTGDGTVFLDLKHDKYFGLDRHKTSLLRSLLDDNHPARDGEHDILASELLERGLLTTDAAAGRLFEPALVELPDAPLLDSVIDEAPRLRFSHLLHFVGACITVWIALKRHSLLYAVQRLKRHRAARVDHCDVDTAQEFVRVFQYLRPFFYVARDNCLFDSLALTEFLRRRGVQTTCVLGVRTLPFAAHCWVQTGRLLVDGLPAQVARFQPILSV